MGVRFIYSTIRKAPRSDSPLLLTQRGVGSPASPNRNTIMQFVLTTLALGALLLSARSPAPAAPVDPKARDTAPVAAQDAFNTAVDAYIYGYPLVTMEMTRRLMTNVAKPAGEYAPMGQFANLRGYPPASNHTVTTPNADTLYSIAWLDLSKEPY